MPVDTAQAPLAPPSGFEDSLSRYGPVLRDGQCGEVIAWGFRITQRIGDARWAELGRHGDLECVYPKWVLVVKWLSRQEAEAKYGPVTDEVFGPRGGWKAITFGETQFCARHLRTTQGSASRETHKA